MSPLSRSRWISLLHPNRIPRRAGFIALVLCFTIAGCRQDASARIHLSTGRVVDRGAVVMTGSAFPPKAIVYSHLKRPDGTEFPPLRFLTDEKGEFTHKIETFNLQAGVHEVWVMDGAGHSSNVERFEVVD